MWLALAAVVALTFFLAVREVARAPARVVSEGAELLDSARSVAEAFRTGTITTRFLSHATTVAGSTKLQFASLDQMEVFERTDEASILWGQFELPDLVVEARAPVQYTYYVDLEGDWRFERKGDRLWVVAPTIRMNRPAVDVSALEYSVRSDSMLRDAEGATQRLREGITMMSVQRGRENVALVRELGRRKIEEFVEAWLGPSFGDAEDWVVEVAFADEAPEEGAPVELPRE